MSEAVAQTPALEGHVAKSELRKMLPKFKKNYIGTAACGEREAYHNAIGFFVYFLL